MLVQLLVLLLVQLLVLTLVLTLVLVVLLLMVVGVRLGVLVRVRRPLPLLLAVAQLRHSGLQPLGTLRGLRSRALLVRRVLG